MLPWYSHHAVVQTLHSNDQTKALSCLWSSSLFQKPHYRRVSSCEVLSLGLGSWCDWQQNWAAGFTLCLHTEIWIRHCSRLARLWRGPLAHVSRPLGLTNKTFTGLSLAGSESRGLSYTEKHYRGGRAVLDGTQRVWNWRTLSHQRRSAVGWRSLSMARVFSQMLDLYCMNISLPFFVFW